MTIFQPHFSNVTTKDRDFSISSRRFGLYKVDETLVMRGGGTRNRRSRRCLSPLYAHVRVPGTRRTRRWAWVARRSIVPPPLLCSRFYYPGGPFAFLNGINFSVDFTWQAAQRSRRREIISFGPRRYRCPWSTTALGSRSRLLDDYLEEMSLP